MTLKEVIAKIEKVLFHPLGVIKAEVEALREELGWSDLPHDATELTAVRDDLVKQLSPEKVDAVDESSAKKDDAGSGA